MIRYAFMSVGVLLVTFSLATLAAEPLAVAPPPRLAVVELVRLLGSDKVQEREEATRKLAALELNEPPVPLLDATQSSNPELRQRAIQAVDAIHQRPTKRARAFAAKGQIDLFVAATKAWNLPTGDDRLWQPALDLASVLVKKSNFGWWPPEDFRKPFSSLAEFRKREFQRFIRSDLPHEQEKYFPNGRFMTSYPGGIMAPGVSSPVALANNIVVSRGEVRTVKGIHGSIVYANGDITVGDLICTAIIVCDGDVTVQDRLLEGLVVARGSIQAKGWASASTLVAGGKIKLVNYTIEPKFLATTMKEDEPNAFEFVTFFELSTVGVEVKVADSAVRVSTITEGKPFAKAGIRAGDTITEVNGKKPDSAESLRRLLRDALAVGDATVKFRRGEKTETVKVALPE
jgi:hypothetical protein